MAGIETTGAGTAVHFHMVKEAAQPRAWRRKPPRAGRGWSGVPGGGLPEGPQGAEKA